MKLLKATLALGSVFVLPLKAYAIFGILFSGGIVIPIIGAAAIFGGGVALEATIAKDIKIEGYGPATAGTTLATLVLDGETNQVSYQPISVEAAVRHQLTEDQRADFNSELEKVNAIASDVGAAVLQAKQRNPELSQADLTRVAAQVWLAHGDDLKAGTRATLARISAL